MGPTAGGAVGRGRRTQPPAFLPTNLSIDPPWLANHNVIICHPQVQGYSTHGGRQYLGGCPGPGSQGTILILSWASSFGDFIKLFQGPACIGGMVYCVVQRKRIEGSRDGVC